MKCASCGNEVADGAKFCTACGKPLGVDTNPSTATSQVNPNVNVQIVMQNGVGGESPNNRPRNLLPQERSDKSMGMYVFLGIVFGFLGIHNFYIGRSSHGMAQLLITLLSGGMLLLVSWIWAGIDVFTIQYDSDGRKLT